MLSKIQSLVKSPKYFRYSFLILFIFVLLNSFVLKGDNVIYALTILSFIFLGVGLYDKLASYLFLSIGILVNWGYFLIQDSSITFYNFFSHFLIYSLIILVSAKLMNFGQRIEANTIGLPTSLAKTLKSEDTYTMCHSEKVAKYAEELAHKMNLPKEQCEIIRTGALLHDIGKVRIPKSILNKPGKLNEKEYDVIKTHPIIGYEIIRDAQMPNKKEILDIVVYHHERYDGKGYPEGLKGKQIPLEARIVAIADTFDAMTSKRVYRNGFEVPYVLDEIRNNKGTQFDPEIVDVFLSMFEKEEQYQLHSVRFESL